MSLTPTQVAALDHARAALRAHPLVRNTYCVSDKRPPTYERKWWLRVLYTDGTAVETTARDDGATAEAMLYERALWAAERKAEAPS